MAPGCFKLYLVLNQSDCFIFCLLLILLKIPEKLLMFGSEQKLCLVITCSSSWLMYCGKWLVDILFVMKLYHAKLCLCTD